MQSDSIAKLAEALAKARAEFKPIVKGKTVKTPQFSYKYADLSDVFDAVIPALSKHGLALVQPIIWRESVMVLETRLIHTSGEWIGGEFPIPNLAKMQDLGSALTYARRYAVSGLLGIAAEDDDDGAAATAAVGKGRKPAAEPKPAPEGPVITPSQAQAYIAACKAAGLSNEGAKALMAEVTGAQHSQDIPASKFEALMEAVAERAGSAA